MVIARVGSELQQPQVAQIRSLGKDPEIENVDPEAVGCCTVHEWQRTLESWTVLSEVVAHFPKDRRSGEGQSIGVLARIRPKMKEQRAQIQKWEPQGKGVLESEGS